jgi:hypothetical protein
VTQQQRKASFASYLLQGKGNDQTELLGEKKEELQTERQCSVFTAYEENASASRCVHRPHRISVLGV